jgi:hypothetical protein
VRAARVACRQLPRGSGTIGRGENVAALRSHVRRPETVYRHALPRCAGSTRRRATIPSDALRSRSGRRTAPLRKKIFRSPQGKEPADAKQAPRRAWRGKTTRLLADRQRSQTLNCRTLRKGSIDTAAMLMTRSARRELRRSRSREHATDCVASARRLVRISGAASGNNGAVARGAQTGTGGDREYVTCRRQRC